MPSNAKSKTDKVLEDIKKGTHQYTIKQLNTFAEKAMEYALFYEASLILAYALKQNSSTQQDKAKTYFRSGQICLGSWPQVPKSLIDIEQAIQHYTQAALYGNKDAQARMRDFSAADYYDMGLYEEQNQNLAEAYKHFYFSAHLGSVDAMLKLGQWYQHGNEAVTKDLEQALRFYAQAKAANYDETKRAETQGKIQEINDENVKIKAVQERLKTQKTEDAATISGLEEQVKAKDKELKTIKTETQEKTDDLSAAQALLEIQQREHAAAVSGLENQVKAKDEELKTIKAATQQKTTELAAAQEQLKRQKGEHVATVSALEEQVKAKAEALEKLQTENEEKTAELATAQEQLETQRTEHAAVVSGFETKVKAKDDELQTLKTGIQEKTAELATAQEQLKRQKGEHVATVSALEKQVKDTNEELEAIKSENKEKTEEVESLKEEQLELQSLLSEANNENDSLSESLENMRNTIGALLQVLSQSSVQSENHIESILDKSPLQTKVRLIEALTKKLNKARQDIQNLHSEQETQQADIANAKNKIQALEQELEEQKSSAVLIEADDQVTLSADTAKQQDPLELHNARIQELAQQIENTRALQLYKLLGKLRKAQENLQSNSNVIFSKHQCAQKILEMKIGNNLNAKIGYQTQLLSLHKLNIQLSMAINENNRKKISSIIEQQKELFKAFMNDMRAQISKGEYIKCNSETMVNLEPDSKLPLLRKINIIEQWYEQHTTKEQEHSASGIDYIERTNKETHVLYIESIHNIITQLEEATKKVQDTLNKIDLSGIEIKRRKPRRQPQPQLTKNTDAKPVIQTTSTTTITTSTSTTASPALDNTQYENEHSNNLATGNGLLAQLHTRQADLRDHRERVISAEPLEPKEPTLEDVFNKALNEKFQNAGFKNNLSDSEDEGYDSWDSDSEDKEETPSFGSNPNIMLAPPTQSGTGANAATVPSVPHRPASP